MSAAPAADELELLASAVRNAASTRTGAALDDALDEIGWLDAFEVAPRAAIESLFVAQGRACHSSGALAAAMLATLAVDHDDSDAPISAPLLLPAFGDAELLGSPASARALAVRGLLLGNSASTGLVVFELEHRLRASTVALDDASSRSVVGLDPDLGLHLIDAELMLDGADLSVSGTWNHAVAIGRLAVGHELVGTMRSMLDLAREHALDRFQFGRPIAGFQAVRHRLAESLVAIEAADAALDGAWTDGSPTAASIAKAACGHSARTVRRHTQQVLAGIGFTTEHDLHRYIRRSITLDGLLGDARTLTERLGSEVLRSGQLPPPLPL